MIEFRSFAGTQHVARVSSFWTNYDGFTTNSFTIGVRSPLHPPLPVVSSLRGFINQSGPDDRGDKACSHLNVTGSLVLESENFKGQIYSWLDAPGNSAPTTAPAIFYNGKLSFVGVLLYPGQSYSYSGVDISGPTYDVRQFRLSVTWLSDSEMVLHRTCLYRYPGGKGTWKQSNVVAKTLIDWSTFRSKMTLTDVYPTRWAAMPYTTYNVGPSIIPIPDRAGIYRRLSSALPTVDVPWSWGDLCQQAANDARMLDINTGMYLYELSQLATSIQETASLVRGRPTPKALASLYLSFHYGYRLSYKDTMKVVKAAHREFHQLAKDYSFVRSMASGSAPIKLGPLKGLTASVTDHYKIYYRQRPELFFRSLSRLFDLDLFPTLENTWDLIPFSFVIDWFTDVSSALADIDTGTQMALLNVLGVLKSRKLVVNGLNGTQGSLLGVGGALSGSWSLTKYVRDRDDHLILPRFQTDASPKFDNWVEATALIVQKRR